MANQVMYLFKSKVTSRHDGIGSHVLCDRNVEEINLF